jgi:predicted RNase H-like nuclease (RuvC/YqgF family)
MLPDEMEAEKNRKLLLAQADEIEIYRKNIRDLQAQLNSAQIHNKNLTQSLANAYDDISRLAEQECFCGLADEPVLAGRD